MHPKEAKKQRIGTGYLTKACLTNARVYSDVNLDENNAFREFINDDSYNHILLYPDSQAWPIDYEEDHIKLKDKPSWYPRAGQEKQLVLHLIDATWPCAKKMMRLSKTLQTLPRATFINEYRSKFVIKHQPHAACLSTIETTYYCLEGLKAKGLEPDLKGETSFLLDALKALVDFQLKCEHDPNIPSNRGTKPRTKTLLKSSRIRPKKNRLFYWDVERSPVGTKGNTDDR
jgi:DTW domain-containing protein YfiP